MTETRREELIALMHKRVNNLKEIYEEMKTNIGKTEKDKSLTFKKPDLKIEWPKLNSNIIDRR